MLPYRDFYYPLNVFMHILTAEEGGVTYLHYGLFESPSDSLPAAQERSTELLLSRLPSPPARLLEVGIGLGTTAALLASRGYDLTGITPDDKQVAMARARHPQLQLECVSYELFDPLSSRAQRGIPARSDAVASASGFIAEARNDTRFDAIVFQESSQYIDSEAIFLRAQTLLRPGGRIVVLDEFALRPVDFPGALHALDRFLAAAAQHGFTLSEELDLSKKAAPSTEYFMARFAKYRDALIADLGITAQQIDELVQGGEKYSRLYREGTYGYRLLVFA